MLVELRQKSQITIPKELVDKLGLSEGDKLDIYEQEGIICIMPVVVYPKGHINKLMKDAVNDIPGSAISTYPENMTNWPIKITNLYRLVQSASMPPTNANA